MQLNFFTLDYPTLLEDINRHGRYLVSVRMTVRYLRTMLTTIVQIRFCHFPEWHLLLYNHRRCHPWCWAQEDS